MAQVTQAEYEEMKRIVRENVCAQCGAELQIRTNPEQGILEIGCPADRSHRGYIEKETWTEAYRRGALVPSYIEDKITKRMLPVKADLDRIIALVATRFPRADLDHPSAATFILDCWRLDLDPLLGEIVPVTFRSRMKVAGGVVEKKVVTPVITEDGWLSLAARGCPEDWLGPPVTVEITDADEKEAICNDREAWVYVAYGYTKRNQHLPLEALPRSPGWLTKDQWEKAKEHGTPAGELPGNQARIRAIKRWIRENFPQARHKMMEMTREWMSRAEGVKEAQEAIDGEYRILGMPGEGEGAAAPAAVATLMTKSQRSFLLRLGKEKLGMNEPQMEIECQGRFQKGLGQLTKKEASEWIELLQTLPVEKQVPTDWGHFWGRCRQLRLSPDQVHELLGVTTITDWLNAGKTLDQALEVIEKAPRQPDIRGPEVEEPLFPEEALAEGEHAMAEAIEPPGERIIERDISLIRTKTDFYTACWEDFKLQPKEALKMTGYSSEMAVPDWGSAYMQVCGSMGAKVVMPRT